MILKWWSCIRLCVWELRWLWRPSITPKWCWLEEPRNNVFEKVLIDYNHKKCHHHHYAVPAHQDDEWCCTEAEVLIPCFTTFSSQHLTSKLCKHSGPIKLDIILIMKDDILTTCPLKRFRKKKIWVAWKYFSLLKEKSSLSSGAKEGLKGDRTGRPWPWKKCQ